MLAPLPGSPPGSLRTDAAPLDLICLSHLRWDFVFQRPQHLVTRLAHDRRVLFVEEPIFDAPVAGHWMELRAITPLLSVAVPHLEARSEPGSVTALRVLLDDAIARTGIDRFGLWYWTPMALPFTRHLTPALVVFDCMDELSGFSGAPPQLLALERELLQRADVVFTGGHSLHKAKATQHRNIHVFPSSVDVAHFAQARRPIAEPADQRDIPRPRLGYFGVIDERMDLTLVEGVAHRRPDWQLVFLGPTAKIDPAAVPRAPNIHYLGLKGYESLPAYLAGWDVALLPFAHNAATRFISPTKTPEYLAAGRPVVSTSIDDVVHPYGVEGLVHIADGIEPFVAAIDAALREDAGRRQAQVDRRLASSSWDRVVEEMSALMAAAVRPSAADTVRENRHRAFAAPASAAPFFQGAPERSL